MSIVTSQGDAPFVIDRCLPRALFERAPGNLELVVAKEGGGDPMKFERAEDAEAFLRAELDDDELGRFEWRIVPVERVTLPR